MFMHGCMNLSDRAERVGVSKFTAYRYSGKARCRYPRRSWAVDPFDMESSESPGARTVLYGGVLPRPTG
jgi:predicted site-specific integrase-resolvase